MTVASAPVEVPVRRPVDFEDYTKIQYLFNQEGIFVLEPSKTNQKMYIRGFIPPEDFVAEITKTYATFSTGIIPRNCIYYEKFTDKRSTPMHIVVLEIEPTILDVVMSVIDNDESARHGKEVFKDKTYTIGLPWCYVIGIIKETAQGLYFDDTIILCRGKPLQLMQDTLCLLPINNLDFNSGHVCWGDYAVPRKDSDTPYTMVQRAGAVFFSSRFNKDLPPKEISTWVGYAGWEKLTKTNPDAIMTADYKKGPVFETLINQLKAGKQK